MKSLLTKSNTAKARVKHMLAASGATLKIRIYADAAAAMSPRTAPIFVTLSDAAQTDTDCAALFTEIMNRHAANMLKLTADPRSTGELRAELSDQYVADVVWATAGFEPKARLVTGREWTRQFGEYLRELWGRLFLTNPAGQ